MHVALSIIRFGITFLYTGFYAILLVKYRRITSEFEEYKSFQVSDILELTLDCILMLLYALAFFNYFLRANRVRRKKRLGISISVIFEIL